MKYHSGEPKFKNLHTFSTKRKTFKYASSHTSRHSLANEPRVRYLELSLVRLKSLDLGNSFSKLFIHLRRRKAPEPWL